MQSLKETPPASPRFTSDDPAYRKYDIGAFTYGNPTVLDWGEGAKLTIGKYCSIADGVMVFLGGEHRTDWVTTYPFGEFFPDARSFPGHPRTKGDVNIGNDVWIATGAMILSGVSIGNGAVIGARAVVAKDVNPFSVCVGNPGRHIRYRFADDVCAKMERIAWWDWPLAKVKDAWPLLLSERIDEFVRRFGNDGEYNDYPAKGADVKS